MNQLYQSPGLLSTKKTSAGRQLWKRAELRRKTVLERKRPGSKMANGAEIASVILRFSCLILAVNALVRTN